MQVMLWANSTEDRDDEALVDELLGECAVALSHTV